MGGTGVVEVDFEGAGIVDELSMVRNVICIVELVVKRRRPRRRRGRAHARGLGLQTTSRILDSLQASRHGPENPNFSEPWGVLVWYRAHVVALAGFEIDEAAQAVDSGVVEAGTGPRRADAGPEQAPGALARLPDAAERVEDYAGRSKSEATIRAYAAGWRDFLDFCEPRGLSPLPASDQTVAGYLATGHRSADMVRRYIREGSLFQSNPAAMVGL